MPFTSSPSKIARYDARAAKIAAAARDDSYDTRQRIAPEAQVACRGCGARAHERCVAERYPSGRTMYYAREFCRERIIDARRVKRA